MRLLGRDRAVGDLVDAARQPEPAFVRELRLGDGDPLDVVAVDVVRTEVDRVLLAAVFADIVLRHHVADDHVDRSFGEL